jgi:hypothetical protein
MHKSIAARRSMFIAMMLRTIDAFVVYESGWEHNYH